MRFRKILIYLATGIIVLCILRLGLLNGLNQYFYNLRNNYFPLFDYRYDDFIPYIPLIVLFGLKIGGVESRSNWRQLLLTILISYATMWIVVYLIKSFSGVTRPDGSNIFSFPSGHTATAFTSACLLYKEFARKKTWIVIVAYLPAIVTGFSRILNNRHWLSDVVGGAIIAILIVEIVYLFRSNK